MKTELTVPDVLLAEVWRRKQAGVSQLSLQRYGELGLRLTRSIARNGFPLKVSNWRPEHAQAWVSSFSGAPATLAMAVSFYASAWPVPGIWDKIIIKRRQVRETRAFSKAEVSAILSSPMHYWLYGLCFIAYHTGARLRSILELRWDDVDFERKTITFRVAKGGKPYTVPGNALLMADLARWRGGGYLFKESLRKRPSSYVSQAFNCVLRRVGVSGASFHSWRHTFVSRLAEAGIEERLAMLLTNHASSVVHRHYVHANAASMAWIHDRLNNDNIYYAPKRVQSQAC